MGEDEEQWRPVAGHEGLYEVSDRGRVRSIDRTIICRNGTTSRRPGKMLKPQITPHGYRRITFGYRRGQQYVQSLVLTAFVGPRPAGLEACHNDGDPSNNMLSNLRWDTRISNMLDQVRHGTHGQARKTHCPLGHALSGPNLYARGATRGIRACLACARARAHIQTHPDAQLAEVAARYYAQLDWSETAHV